MREFLGAKKSHAMRLEWLQSSSHVDTTPRSSKTKLCWEAGRFVALLTAALWAGSGCHSPPENACQGVGFRWPYLDFEPSDDSSDSPGLQVDLAIRTGLAPGMKASVQVSTVDGDTFTLASESSAEVQGDGLLNFPALDMPIGDVLIVVETLTACGPIRSSRQTFVVDEHGVVRCALRVLGEESTAGEPLRRLSTNADQDPDAEMLQARVRIGTGRSDVGVRLFVQSSETGEAQELAGNSGDSDEALFDVELGEGEVSMRAICTWVSEGETISSSSINYLVETL